jgi:ankyrin repeat protein
MTPVAGTPDARSKWRSPPSCPNVLKKRLHEDIELALLKKSMPLLSLTLLRGHCCGDSSHGVHEAVRRQHMGALEFLLQHSSKDNVDRHCNGRRPLHLAINVCVVEGDIGHRMADLLLRYGANPNFVDGDDPLVDSPLPDSTKRGCTVGMELLLKYKANPDHPDVAGFTPLHLACKGGMSFIGGNVQHRIVGMLLHYGACPIPEDKLGMTPLRYAALGGTVHKQLAMAERLWHRCTLLLVRGSGRQCAKGGTPPCEDAVMSCLFMPGLVDLILPHL